MQRCQRQLPIASIKIFDIIIEERKNIYNLYRRYVCWFRLIEFLKVKYNFVLPYYFRKWDWARDQAYNKMKSENIFCENIGILIDQKILFCIVAN